MSQTAPASKRHQRIPAEAATDTGNVRSVNEDRYWNAPESFDLISISRKGQLFVVADGMGGYHAGDIAAEIVVKTMGESYYSDAANAMQDVMSALKFSIAQCQKKVNDEQRKSADHAQMGSTLVAAVVRADEVFVANVGDARCYRLRNGQIKQLSKDHSWVAEQVAAGVLKQSEIKGHPLRSAVTRAIGQPQASPEPDIQRFDWQANDRLLLCSDGLWDMVPEDKLVALLGIPKATDTAAELIKAANMAGGQDNITAVVVGDLPEPPMLSRLTAPRNLPKALAVVGGLLGVSVIALALSLSGAFRPSEAPAEPPPPVVEPTKKPAKPPTAAPADAATAATAAQAPATAAPVPPTVAATPTLRGSGAAKATPGKPAAQATGTASGSAALIPVTSVGAYKFCTQLSGDSCANTQSTFAGSTATVYVSWQLPPMPDGTRLKVTWLRNGVPQGQPDTCTITSGKCAGSADLTPTYGVFHLGSYSGDRRGTYAFQLVVGNDSRPTTAGAFQVN